MKRPVGVTVISILAIIGGALQLLASFGYLGISALRMPLLTGTLAATTPMMLFTSGLFSLVIGVVAVVFGIGALGLRSWAWITGIVLYAVDIVYSGLMLLATGFTLVPLVSLVIAIVVIAYLSSGSVRSAFHVSSGDHFTTQHPSPV